MNSSTPPSDSTPAFASDTVFDVRPIPSRVKHLQIFQRWADLSVGQFFILLNDHDPVPLRYQFEAEYPDAFLWKYLERGPEEFRVKITKLKAITVATHSGQATQPVATTPTVTGGVQQIDVCGLEPPEPLIRILDAIESLPAGVALRAHTDREPCHLFGEAEQRGFLHDSKEEPDGSWITVLTRA